MSSIEPLEEDALKLALAALPGWKLDGGKLRKRFVLGSFKEAMAFLVRLSYEAEALNHHPEIHNVYKTVELALTTHDAGNKVTVKDVELAAAIENFF